MANTFLDLQNGFYNALSQGLGFPTGSPFQIYQPSPPLIAGAHQDQLLWNYFNLIPTFTLTNHYTPSGGNQFFIDYSGLLSVLQGAPNTFEQDVGPAVNTAWTTYLESVTTPFTLNQLPAMFQRWAVIHGHIGVANKGANDLAAMILDPVTAAQLAIMPYSGGGTREPDWDSGYNDLVRILAKAPSRKFSFSSSTMDSNVSKTWCNGNQSAFFGLWSNSSHSSSQSATFAASGVSLQANFQHVTPFTAVPGSWYSSSAMGDAFSHQSGAPWVAGPINWQTTFSPTNGNLARFANSLIVVYHGRIRSDVQQLRSNRHHAQLLSRFVAILLIKQQQWDDDGRQFQQQRKHDRHDHQQP